METTAEDIDRVVGSLAVAGRAPSTRREYVQIFKGFHWLLQVRKAAEIEAVFGVKLVCPVDEFNASRHVGDDSPALVPPPTPERVREFFEFMKAGIITARNMCRQLGTTRCSGRSIMPDCARQRLSCSTFRMCISIVGRSANFMSASVRAPGCPVLGRDGLRCSTV